MANKIFDNFSGKSFHEKMFEKFKDAKVKFLIPFTDALLIRPPRLAEPIVGPFQNDALQPDVPNDDAGYYDSVYKAINYWLKQKLDKTYNSSMQNLLTKIKEVCSYIPGDSNVIIVMHWTGNYNTPLNHTMYETVKYYGRLSDILIGNHATPFNGTGVPWLDFSGAFKDGKSIQTIDYASNGYHASNEAYCIIDTPGSVVHQYAQTGIFHGTTNSVMVSTGGIALITEDKIGVEFNGDDSYILKSNAWGFQFQARNFYAILQDALVIAGYIAGLRERRCNVLVTDHSSIRLAADSSSDKDRYNKHYDYGASFAGIWLMHFINAFLDNGTWTRSNEAGKIVSQVFPNASDSDNRARYFGIINPITEDVIGYYEFEDKITVSTYDTMQKDLIRSLKQISNLRSSKAEIVRAHTVYMNVDANKIFPHVTLYGVELVDDSDKNKKSFGLSILFNDAITYGAEIMAQHAIDEGLAAFPELQTQALEALDDILFLANASNSEKQQTNLSYNIENTNIGDQLNQVANAEYKNFSDIVKSARADIEKATTVKGVFNVLKAINTRYSAYFISTYQPTSNYIEGIDSDCVDPYDLAAPANRKCYGLVRTIGDIQEDYKKTIETTLLIIDVLPLIGIATKLGKLFVKGASKGLMTALNATNVVDISKNIKALPDKSMLSLSTVLDNRLKSIAQTELKMLPSNTNIKNDAVKFLAKSPSNGTALDYSLRAAATGFLTSVIDNGLSVVIHNRFLTRLLGDFIGNYTVRTVTKLFENAGSRIGDIALNATIKTASGFFRNAKGQFMKIIGWPVINVSEHLVRMSTKPVSLLLTAGLDVTYLAIGDEIIETASQTFSPTILSDDAIFTDKNSFDSNFIYTVKCDSDEIVKDMQLPTSQTESNIIKENKLNDGRVVIDASDYDGLVIRGDNSVLIHRIPKDTNI